MENDREVYKLLVSNKTKEMVSDHFGGIKKITEPLISAVLSSLFTITSMFVFSGGIEMSELWIVVLGAIGGPIALFFGIWIISWIKAPFEIYKEQNKKIDPFDWSRVDISVSKFHIKGLYCWGVSIKNDKDIPLQDVSVTAFKKMEGSKIEKFSDKYVFGYVDRNDEVIVWENTTVKSKKVELFVITSYEPMPNSMPYIRTKDMRYPILSPDYTLWVEINAKTNENYSLPAEIKRYDIYPDGEIVERRKFIPETATQQSVQPTASGADWRARLGRSLVRLGQSLVKSSS